MQNQTKCKRRGDRAMTDTEQELKEAIQETHNDDELTELQWEIIPKTVRFEIPLRYMSRMELRELLNTLAGALQECIHETHEERRALSMINNINSSLEIAQRINHKYRDTQRERVIDRHQISTA